jgi:hypothetical protein
MLCIMYFQNLNNLYEIFQNFMHLIFQFLIENIGHLVKYMHKL